MPDATSAIKEWEEVKEAVDATVSETSLPDIEPQGNLTSLVLANII